MAVEVKIHTVGRDVNMLSSTNSTILKIYYLDSKPAMLLLDEATSHLDLKNEELISHALKRSGLTQLVVAHRPRTIAQADWILKIENLGFIEIIDKE